MSRKLQRNRCVVYPLEDNNFKLISFGDSSAEWTVDSIALWIWLLVEEQQTDAQIVSQLCEQYADLSKEEAQVEVDRQVELGLLVDTSTEAYKKGKQSVSPARIPSLSVYFTDNEDLDPKNNFLVWMLWHVAHTVVITKQASEADVVFHSNYDSAQIDDAFNVCLDLPLMNDGDSANDVAILDVGTETKKESALRSFDCIVSEAQGVSPIHLKWLRLPSGYMTSSESLAEQLITSHGGGYKVQRLADRFATMLTGETKARPLPAKLVPEEPLLTIGMATYDDYDGVYFSVLSLVLHHHEVFKNSEIIILDNNPDGKAGASLEKLAEVNKNVRYVPYVDKNSTAVRDVIFHLARGKWVVCMDCHVMYPTGVLDNLVDYMKENPDSTDMLQGPILSDSGSVMATHFTEGWSTGMYGYWGMDEKGRDAESEPFEIPMQGLGVFACRKAAWPGFNSKFDGFGGEEGYIHQKFRNLGGKCLCLPFFRWGHRFDRPNGATYPNNWKGRIKNYLIGFKEAGLDTKMVAAHFTDHVNAEVVAEAKAEVTMIENSPFYKFDYIACINLKKDTNAWEEMTLRFSELGIEQKVKRFIATPTPELYAIGNAMAHRQIIENAKNFGYKSVLVFHDDARILSGAPMFFTQALQELEGRDWNVLYLGADEQGFEVPLLENCQHLKKAPEQLLKKPQAIAYHQSVYDEILEALPDSESEMAEWLAKNHSLDTLLSSINERYMVYPKLCTTKDLQDKEDLPYAHYYR